MYNQSEAPKAERAPSFKTWQTAAHADLFLPWKFLRFPSQVHGVLMRLSPEDWGTLRRSEVGYVVEDVAVELELGDGDGDGSLTMASAFVSQSDLLLPPNSGVPTTRYLGLIKEGAGHHNLPGPYQQWLQSLDSVRSVPRSNYNTRRERRARAGIVLAAAAALAAWIASL